MRRYALAVILGIGLGLGLLALLRAFGVGAPPAPTGDATQSGPANAATLTDADLRPLLGRSAGGEGSLPPLSRPPSRQVEPLRRPAPDAACDGPVDCLLTRAGSAWRVELEAFARPAPGERILATLRSAESGLVTFFLVEGDGTVLLLYPTPGGEVPVVRGGVANRLPRPGDGLRLRWSQPGRRHLVALVSTEPFLPPKGEPISGQLTLYSRESGEAERFFAVLEERIAADLEAGTGLWAVAAAEVLVAGD